MSTRASVIALACCLSATGLQLTTPCFAWPGGAQQAPAEAGQNALVRRIGAIKSINNNVITLAPDSGSEISVNVNATTRILRVAPGEKNLKNATAAELQDLQVGDRVLVGGETSADAKSIAASSIVLMKRSDVEARQQTVLNGWQHGVGGLVTAVDLASQTVTISVTGFGGTKSVGIRASGATVIRRYAPDSMKFEDAKPSTLHEIHPGDQLRARGSRTQDGTELTAEEIVTGSFRNVAGTVKSVDAASGTISVEDVLSKKSVQVRIGPESQLRKLPAEFAQRIAARLKGGSGDPAAAVANQQPNPPAAAMGNGHGARPESVGGKGGISGHSGGGPDFQQMLNRMPAVVLSDLHKGDAVMIVATQGASSNGGTSTDGTAITLLIGVEPILQAAPSGSQAMMLSPWSLGGPSGDAQNQ
jgi:hypothetical protein